MNQPTTENDKLAPEENYLQKQINRSTKNSQEKIFQLTSQNLSAKKHLAHGAIGPTVWSTRMTIRTLKDSASSRDQENASVGIAQMRKLLKRNPALAQMMMQLNVKMMIVHQKDPEASLAQMITVLKDLGNLPKNLLKTAMMKMKHRQLMSVLKDLLAMMIMSVQRDLLAMIMRKLLNSHQAMEGMMNAMKTPAAMKAVEHHRSSISIQLLFLHQQPLQRKKQSLHVTTMMMEAALGTNGVAGQNASEEGHQIVSVFE